MADTDNQAAATVETTAEFKKSPTDFTRHWIQAIEMAGKEEEKWREDAKTTLERYRKSKAQSFNILFANTQTTVPALYNSEPAPDVRRRFTDKDPDGEAVSRVIERLLSIQAELYDFDGCMKAAVKDRQLQGRGVTRVRVMQGANGSKRVVCEPVIWDDYRRGPAKRWEDVPWHAFRHRMTREELVELDPKVGERVELDATISDAPDKDKSELPDMFKRAIVWEVWDVAERLVYFFAESFKDGPITVLEDPYKLRTFVPVPRPLYAVETTDTLIPVCEFMIWKPLADEMDDITARIAGIIKVMKMRGLYDGAFAGLIEKLANLDDGELAAADDAARSMQQGGIEKAVWMWPVDMAIQVVEALYVAREQAKAALYELTGVADIMRGQTEASETLGAQRIKAQWGSLRLQEAQRDVQRYARDLYRMMADLFGEVLEPQEIAAMTGVMLTPEQYQLFKTDLQREFAIEIETDSTIRADLSRTQENIAGFVTGFGAFLESVGPAVEAGYMPPETAVGLLRAFARYYKLGREAETIMDDWEKKLVEKAKQPPAPPPPDPKLEAEKMKAEGVAAKVQGEMAKTKMAGEIAAAEHQMSMQERQAEFSMKMATLKAEFEMFQAEHMADMQARQADAAITMGEHQLRRDELAQGAEAAEHGHGLKMEVMAEQAKAKKAAANKPNGSAKR